MIVGVFCLFHWEVNSRNSFIIFFFNFFFRAKPRIFVCVYCFKKSDEHQRISLKKNYFLPKKKFLFLFYTVLALYFRLTLWYSFKLYLTVIDCSLSLKVHYKSVRNLILCCANYGFSNTYEWFRILSEKGVIYSKFIKTAIYVFIFMKRNIL